MALSPPPQVQAVVPVRPQAVDDAGLVRSGDDRGGLVGGLLGLGLKPGRVKEVQAVALAGQPLEELQNPLPAHFRVGVGDGHGVLRGVPIAQAGASPHLDEGGGHKLMGVLIEQLIVDDAVLIMTARAIERHLKILIVNGNLVVRKFRVGVHAEGAGPVPGVLQRQVPQLHILPPEDEQGLGGADAVSGTLIHRVAQPVAAAVILRRSAAGLPGDGPIFPRLVVAQVDVVPGPLHGNAVGPEADDPVVFRAFVKEVAPGGVVGHGAQVLHPQVVGPGDGHVDAVDHILSLFLVKVSTFHGGCPLLHCCYCRITETLLKSIAHHVFFCR